MPSDTPILPFGSANAGKESCWFVGDGRGKSMKTRANLPPLFHGFGGLHLVKLTTSNLSQ